ncbi:hypothetical protein AGMMS50225_23930 [Betaproteobacteria bacterium]|nr:hypothetical protein AGMMS50225_23930 [Betaproteobacteria bacterium]
MKDDAAIHRRRAQHEADLASAMQTHAGGADDGFERALSDHDLSFRWCGAGREPGSNPDPAPAVGYFNPPDAAGTQES